MARRAAHSIGVTRHQLTSFRHAARGSTSGHHTSLLLLIAVVLGYQTLGTIGEWVMKGDFMLACQDFRMGIPGMLLQIAGGYLILPKK